MARVNILPATIPAAQHKLSFNMPGAKGLKTSLFSSFLREMQVPLHGLSTHFQVTFTEGKQFLLIFIPLIFTCISSTLAVLRDLTGKHEGELDCAYFKLNFRFLILFSQHDDSIFQLRLREDFYDILLMRLILVGSGNHPPPPPWENFHGKIPLWKNPPRKIPPYGNTNCERGR